MKFHQLNGLTPEQLHALIMKSPIGFSAEGGFIQYLGKQIQLHEGSTTLPEQIVSPVGGKQLFERLVTLQPELETQLPNTKAEAIQMIARKLVREFLYEALEISPNKEVQFAVLLECLRHGIRRTINHFTRKNFLSEAENLRILLAASEKLKWPASIIGEHLAQFFPFSFRLEETKKMFQRFPDSFSLEREAKEINEYLAELDPDLSVTDRFLEFRQFFKSENNKISRQLLGEVDNIGKIFILKINCSGGLPEFIAHPDFNTYTTKLLYLYAACSGFSQEADDAELASYISSVLYCTTDSDSIWHIAKELAYLSKKPGSIDYCRYIDAVANILKTPPNIASEFTNSKQLSDLKGFALLESHKTLAPYLAVLRANIDSMTPEYSQVLLPEVDILEHEFADISLPEGKPAIKAKVHRLLLVIAACRSSRQIMNTSTLAYFARAIMKHGNKKNIPYLISGLARLVQSTPKIQQILGMPEIKGGDHLRLAPLQLLAFVPNVISEDDVEVLCQSLQAGATGRRLMKDGKVYHQWLATLEEASVSKYTNKAILRTILQKLTQSLTYEKLGLLHIAYKMGHGFNIFLESIGFNGHKERLKSLTAGKNVLERIGLRWHGRGIPVLVAEKGVLESMGLNFQTDGLPFLIAEKGILESMGLSFLADGLPFLITEKGVLESMGFSWQDDGLPLLIAAKGVDALVGESKGILQWLLKQRHYHLLPVYLASKTTSDPENKELVPLIHEFIKAITNNTFIENRQSPLNNQHLQLIYQNYPKFQAGWGANFSNFSKKTRNKLLSPGETLELTEDPWDLFISGLELKTCQSPDSLSGLNSGLMGYVMDGRNAMIVKKNKNGNILSRSVIRMAFDQNYHPVLFLEKGYPDKSALLFIDAAREIAAEMKLPLYHCVDSVKDKKIVSGEVVKFLEGRAPIDYFDMLREAQPKKRQKVTLTKVQLDMTR